MKASKLKEILLNAVAQIEEQGEDREINSFIRYSHAFMGDPEDLNNFILRVVEEGEGELMLYIHN